MNASLGRTQILGLLIGLAGFVLTLTLAAPAEWPIGAWRAVGLIWLMACLWVSEALPLAVTALLPILLAPVLGLQPLSEVTSAYAHPMIFLFLGGFVLGLAMERWGLHERLSLWLLVTIGATPMRELIGFMLAAAFLSMWVSNTATAIMMLPIALSVIRRRTGGKALGHPYAIAMLLGIAWGANVGGIGTLIGSPPNALLAAYLSEQFDIAIGFADWMLIALPVSLSMLLLLALWLGWRMQRGLKQHPVIPGDQTVIRQQYLAKGGLSSMEWRVCLVFAATAGCWILRPLLDAWLPGLALSDAAIAIAAVVVLHLLPAGGEEKRPLMVWSDTARLPWDVLLLFGGGLALAGVIQSTGLADLLAALLGQVGSLPVVLMVLLVALCVTFMTQVTSNTATVAAFLPVLGAIAISQGVPPELLAVPAAMAASCAFMMPVATPPNAIVFSSGCLRIQDMLRAGLLPNLVGAGVITLLCLVLL